MTDIWNNLGTQKMTNILFIIRFFCLNKFGNQWTKCRANNPVRLYIILKCHKRDITSPQPNEKTQRQDIFCEGKNDKQSCGRYPIFECAIASFKRNYELNYSKAKTYHQRHQKQPELELTQNQNQRKIEVIRTSVELYLTNYWEKKLN